MCWGVDTHVDTLQHPSTALTFLRDPYPSPLHVILISVPPFFQALTF